MQLRFKIITVFILSLVVSVVVFLTIFAILIASPISGGYSEKDMNLAADSISKAVIALPEITQPTLAPIFRKWQKKYPKMTFTIAVDSKVLFSTAKKNNGITPDLLKKVAMIPNAFPNETPEKELPTFKWRLMGEGEKIDVKRQLGLIQQQIEPPPVDPKKQGTTINKAQLSDRTNQMMIISNVVSPDNPLKKNGFYIYSVMKRNSGERILAREIKRPGQAASFLLITVKSQFYTAIELFTDPQKADVIIQIFIMGLGFTLIFTSIFAITFTHNISRRFNRLSTVIDSFELGNLNVQIKDPARDEIGRIAATFNRMTEKIRQQFSREQADQEQRRQLISDVSHDLRTPLTAIIGYTESLENGVYESPDEQRDFAGIIRKKALYMEKLLDELLEFSRMESDNFELQLAEVDLAELAREILIEYLPFIKEQSIKFEANIPEAPVLVKADSNRISRALRNLIDNALKYGAQGKYLRVAVTATAAAVMIEVEDHGPGVKEAEQTKIFDRFYRADKGRNSKLGGVGLGLAIAGEIVKKHGGQIRVASEKDVRTVFTIELPVS